MPHFIAPPTALQHRDPAQADTAFAALQTVGREDYRPLTLAEECEDFRRLRMALLVLDENQREVFWDLYLFAGTELEHLVRRPRLAQHRPLNIPCERDDWYAGEHRLRPPQGDPPVCRRRTRRPSITAELRAARRAGAVTATVTRPDGVAVTATFGEPAQAQADTAFAAVNSWSSAIADLEAKQGRH
jgi:hypothetical protein